MHSMQKSSLHKQYLLTVNCELLYSNTAGNNMHNVLVNCFSKVLSIVYFIKKVLSLRNQQLYIKVNDRLTEQKA